VEDPVTAVTVHLETHEVAVQLRDVRVRALTDGFMHPATILSPAAGTCSTSEHGAADATASDAISSLYVVPSIGKYATFAFEIA
jgi:hypothetical protein